MTASAAAMLTCDLYSPEQIFITPEWIKVLKDFEKAVTKKAQDKTQHELLQMCYNWFSAAHALRKRPTSGGSRPVATWQPRM